MTPEEHKELSQQAGQWSCSPADAMSSCGAALDSWLTANPPVPSVPTSELQTLLGRDSQSPSARHLPLGEGGACAETDREDRVAASSGGETRMMVGVDDDWGKVKFDHADFAATDWEVVR